MECGIKMSAISEGYNVDDINAPKFISRGEWDLTGTAACDAYWPLKPVITMTTGGFGSSGTYETNQWCAVYDDVSGLSGCIGASIRKIRPISHTGVTVNQNLNLRKFAVMHEGYLPMLYKAGTLDGVPQTMVYGMKIAPTTSGFRTHEKLNLLSVQLIGETTGQVYGTGIQQCELGWWADIASNLTGERFRVKVNPHFVSGQTLAE